MKELEEQLDGDEKMLPFIILDDSVAREIDAMVFVYTDDEKDNKSKMIRVRNDGRQLYFLWHSHISDTDYDYFQKYVIPNMAKELLTDKMNLVDAI